MTGLGLFLASLSVLPANQVTLSRGGPGDQSFRYWAVTDTFIDRKSPDENFGRDLALLGGPDKTILIRFGDLNRLIPNGSRITKAALVLHQELGAAPKLESIGRVTVPWGEGPGRRGTLMAAINKDQPKGTKPVVPNLAATWKHRRGGIGAISWGESGATDPSDVERIPGATMTANSSDVRISGLEATVQKMLDHPYDNEGFALRFANEVEFSSSDAVNGKPSLEITFSPELVAAGPDLCVTNITSDPASDGEKETTWTAHIKNLGTAAASGFTANWTINEKSASSIQMNQSLAPGEETTVAIAVSLRRLPADHRGTTIKLVVAPSGPDVNPANNGRVVFGEGIPVTIVMSGSDSEQRAYDAIDFWNETIAEQSRFSFAREGTFERIRLRKAIVRQDSISPVIDPVGGVITVGSSASLRDLAKSLLLAIGGPDLSVMATDPKSNLMAGQDPIRRVSMDQYPGLTGGDTRDDIETPRQNILPYEPAYDKAFDGTSLPATDLMSATEVGRINALMGIPRSETQNKSWELPSVIVTRLIDAGGRTMANADFEVFQVQEGKIIGPVQSGKTNAKGSGIVLSNRGGNGKGTPFGDLGADLKSGLLLMKVRTPGGVDFAWLKAWQMIDTYQRGTKAAAIFDVHFNLNDFVVDQESNLALNRILADSSGLLPAQLAPLVDGLPGTSMTWGAKENDWIEIDLGRDRPIGEVCFEFDDPQMWPAFDILVYGTGQRPSEAAPFARELNGPYTRAVRGEGSSLGYRGFGTRARYIRVLLRADAKPVRISEIRVRLSREQ